MSAAAAVVVEAPSLYLEPALISEERQAMDLIHELRQPLSSIEAIAYYLEMTLPAEHTEARQYMRRVQQLVEQASTLLNEAAVSARA